MPEIHRSERAYGSMHYRNREDSEVSIIEVPHRRSGHAYMVTQTHTKPQGLDFSFMGLQTPEQDDVKAISSPLSMLSPFTSSAESDSPFRAFEESPEFRPIAFSGTHRKLRQYSATHLASLREEDPRTITNKRRETKSSITHTTSSISSSQLSDPCELKSAFDDTKLRSSDDLRPLEFFDGQKKNMGSFKFSYSSGDDSILSETPRTPDIAPGDASMVYSTPLTLPSELALKSLHHPSKTQQDLQEEISPLCLSNQPKRLPRHQTTGSTSVSTTMLSFLSVDKSTNSSSNSDARGDSDSSEKNVLSLDDWSQKLDEKLKMDDCFTIELKPPVLKTIPEPPSLEELRSSPKKGLFVKSNSSSTTVTKPVISGPTLVKKNGVDYHGPDDPVVHFSTESQTIAPISSIHHHHQQQQKQEQQPAISRKLSEDLRYSILSAESIGEVQISEIPSTAPPPSPPPPPPSEPLCVPPPLPDIARKSGESYVSSFYSVNSERQRHLGEGVAFSSIAPNTAVTPKEKFTAKLKRTFGRKPKRPSNDYEEDIEEFLNQKSLNTKQSLISHLSSEASTYSLDNKSSRSNVFSRMKPHRK
ncbi:hypothetical protein TRVA0_051S00474 [Trichomonascus vanleenenianus]|uniref:uncharacterized protein n=1 Tax=Trichomonascus vanleenenianus TaxID=2268995 RepID=UPI003ECB8E2B